MVETEPPQAERKVRGVGTRTFVGRHFDYSGTESKDNGLLGEKLVVEHEREYLRSIGRLDLAAKVMHTSIVEGDGAGYDVLSFDADGSVRYIEVKSTTGGIGTPFIMTVNEAIFAEQFHSNYYLYRVYGLKKEAQKARFYILRPPLNAKCDFEPIQFRVKLK